MAVAKIGYEVTSIVDTGEKAIAKAEADKPDLILMDIRIKGEMDGIDTAEVIRNRFGIPVIFSTAYLDEERIELAKLTMPFGYVLKPVQERDLKVTIEMALYVAKADAEKRLIDKRLQESEEKYRLAFKTSPEAVNINQMDGTYVDINEGFTRLTGFTKEDVIGKLSSEIKIWSIPEDREKLISGLNSEGFVDNLESKFSCKDGSFKIALMSATVIELNNEPHILSITRDISERKKNRGGTSSDSVDIFSAVLPIINEHVSLQTGWNHRESESRIL
jgi:PAS domain S-box-containing protein